MVKTKERIKREIREKEAGKKRENEGGKEDAQIPFFFTLSCANREKEETQRRETNINIRK